MPNDSRQAGVSIEELEEYLLPYVEAWGFRWTPDGGVVGDGFDECATAKEAASFLASGVVGLFGNTA